MKMHFKMMLRFLFLLDLVLILPNFIGAVTLTDNVTTSSSSLIPCGEAVQLTCNVPTIPNVISWLKGSASMTNCFGNSDNDCLPATVDHYHFSSQSNDFFMLLNTTKVADNQTSFVCSDTSDSKSISFSVEVALDGPSCILEEVSSDESQVTMVFKTNCVNLASSFTMTWFANNTAANSEEELNATTSSDSTDFTGCTSVDCPGTKQTRTASFAIVKPGLESTIKARVTYPGKTITVYSSRTYKVLKGPSTTAIASTGTNTTTTSSTTTTTTSPPTTSSTSTTTTASTTSTTTTTTTTPPTTSSTTTTTTTTSASSTLTTTFRDEEHSSTQPPSSTNNDNNKSERTIIIVVSSTVGGVVLCGLLALLGLFLYRSRKSGTPQHKHGHKKKSSRQAPSSSYFYGRPQGRKTYSIYPSYYINREAPRNSYYTVYPAMSYPGNSQGYRSGRFLPNEYQMNEGRHRPPTSGSVHLATYHQSGRFDNDYRSEEYADSWDMY